MLYPESASVQARSEMRQQFRLFVILAIAAAHWLGAQQPSFRIFSTEDGLVRNWVTRIRRDSKGYLWFCTVEGISLYDGYRFTNFSTRDGLPSRLVSDMIETSRGDYWFATEAGLARFHRDPRKAPVFEAIRLGESKPSNDVQALLEAHDGTIWSGTASGLYQFRPQDGEAAPRFVPLGVPGPLIVRALAEDARRNLWVATDRALFRRRPGGEIDSLSVPVPMPYVGTLLVDGHDRLWVGSFGLVAVDTRTEPPHVLPVLDVVNRIPGLIGALYPGEHGEIWLGKSTGLVRFLPDAVPPYAQLYTPSDAFPIDHIAAIEQDVRHNLWLGVGTRGVARIAAGSFELFTRGDGLASTETLGLVESFRGTLYAVTGQWTLNELRGNRFFPIPLRVPNPGSTWAVGQTLVQDREGTWWAASGAGVVRYPPATDARDLAGKSPERVYSLRDGLPDPLILRVFRDSRDDIWAGTSGGVGHWSRATRRWTGFRTGDLIPGSTSAAAVHSFAEDSAGNVWAGIYPSGLIRFHGSGHELVSREVPRGAINALLSDSQGRLWIGSSQGGLGRMDHPGDSAPKIQRYGLEQGFSSEHVFSLAEDAEGRLYVAGGRGVDRLDPGKGTLHHFTTSSGLPPGETQFLFRDRQGSIWFSSTYGLARYKPEPDQTAETPSPLLRAVRVGGEPYPIAETGERSVTGMELTPGRNSLEVEFRALQFDIGDGIRYQYRLEGADTDWSKPSAGQTVRYANLAPGRYRFAVRSVTEAGQVSNGQGAIGFEVLPVLWRRGWFVALVLSVIVAGAVSLHRSRVNHLLALVRLRTRLATDLHDDLGAGLAEIAILGEVAKRQQGPRSLELLDRIAERARTLRAAMADIVWTVDPREDCLADLVLRMRQTAFTMLENEGRRVEFRSPGDERLGKEVAPDVRRHALLFFKEVVTNVARHADATSVQVEIAVAGGFFRISIRDNGRGFDPLCARAGQGLKSLRYRAKELGGSFRLESASDHGTEIELSVPF